AVNSALLWGGVPDPQRHAGQHRALPPRPGSPPRRPPYRCPLALLLPRLTPAPPHDPPPPCWSRHHPHSPEEESTARVRTTRRRTRTGCDENRARPAGGRGCSGRRTSRSERRNLAVQEDRDHERVQRESLHQGE